MERVTTPAGQRLYVVLWECCGSEKQMPYADAQAIQTESRLGRDGQFIASQPCRECRDKAAARTLSYEISYDAPAGFDPAPADGWYVAADGAIRPGQIIDNPDGSPDWHATGAAILGGLGGHERGHRGPRPAGRARRQRRGRGDHPGLRAGLNPEPGYPENGATMTAWTRADGLGKLNPDFAEIILKAIPAGAYEMPRPYHPLAQVNPDGAAFAAVAGLPSLREPDVTAWVAEHEDGNLIMACFAYGLESGQPYPEPGDPPYYYVARVTVSEHAAIRMAARRELAAYLGPLGYRVDHLAA
jgi:hypothetical protein